MMFSVIIPTFNRIATLQVTLNSIFAQSREDTEVIVIDDGSTDGTPEYLRSIEERVRWRQQSNMGAGAARNQGADLAIGEYLAFLDSDDIWFPWTIEIYDKAVRVGGRPSFLVGKPALFFEDGQLDGIVQRTFETKRFADYLSSGDEWRWWGASSFVIRRDVFSAVGGFSASLINGEDADLALRLGVARGFVQITSPPTFGYRQHAGGLTNDLGRSIEGALVQIRTEKAGCYPGGPRRARERRMIITRHVRSLTLQSLRAGFERESWRLYRGTFFWNAVLIRARYLVIFPILYALSRFRYIRVIATYAHLRSRGRD